MQPFAKTTVVALSFACTAVFSAKARASQPIQPPPEDGYLITLQNHEGNYVAADADGSMSVRTDATFHTKFNVRNLTHPNQPIQHGDEITLVPQYGKDWGENSYPDDYPWFKSFIIRRANCEEDDECREGRDVIIRSGDIVSMYSTVGRAYVDQDSWYGWYPNSESPVELKFFNYDQRATTAPQREKQNTRYCNQYARGAWNIISRRRGLHTDPQSSCIEDEIFNHITEVRNGVLRYKDAAVVLGRSWNCYSYSDNVIASAYCKAQDNLSTIYFEGLNLERVDPKIKEQVEKIIKVASFVNTHYETFVKLAKIAIALARYGITYDGIFYRVTQDLLDEIDATRQQFLANNAETLAAAQQLAHDYYIGGMDFGRRKWAVIKFFWEDPNRIPAVFEAFGMVGQALMGMNTTGNVFGMNYAMMAQRAGKVVEEKKCQSAAVLVGETFGRNYCDILAMEGLNTAALAYYAGSYGGIGDPSSVFALLQTPRCMTELAILCAENPRAPFADEGKVVGEGIVQVWDSYKMLSFERNLARGFAEIGFPW